MDCVDTDALGGGRPYIVVGTGKRPERQPVRRLRLIAGGRETAR